MAILALVFAAILGEPLRLGTTDLTHTAGVSDVACSPDGRLIASAGFDDAVRIWDAATGQAIRSIEHPSTCRKVVWTRDGKFLVVASDGEPIRWRDVSTGRSVREIPVRPGTLVSALRLSPDERFLAVGVQDTVGAEDANTLSVWDLRIGRELWTRGVHRSYDVAFSPDGSRLLMGGEPGRVVLWDVATGREVRSLRGHESGTCAVAFSPDGKRVAGGGTYPDTSVIVWDASDGRKVHVIPRGAGTTYALSFTPDGRALVVGGGSDDPNIRAFDAASGAEIRRFGGAVGYTNAIAFSPDGSMMVGVSRTGPTVRRWDFGTGRPLGTSARHTSVVLALAVSPDGARIASGGADREIRIWDRKTGRPVRVLAGQTATIWALAYSPDGRTLASGGNDRAVELWDAESGRPIRKHEGHRYRVTAVAFSPDGRTLASATGDEAGLAGARNPDGTVQLWDVASGESVREILPKCGYLSTVTFSPDGRLLATAGIDDATVRLWDPVTGREVGRLERRVDPISAETSLFEGFRSIAFSPDGSALVGLSHYEFKSNLRPALPDPMPPVRMVTVWELATRKIVAEVPWKMNAIRSVAFAGDGRTLGFGTQDGTVLTHDLSDPARTRLREGHAGAVNVVAFTPDRRGLVSGSDDTTLAVWDLSGDRP